MSFLRRWNTHHEPQAKNKHKVVVNGSKYEVFLSFYGQDTRLSFVDFLYEDLKAAGVITFRDEEGLRKGETIRAELLSAIQQSSISMPIFSKGYANSKWCLWELEEMVKCKKENGQKIFPVFYDVEPTNVRNQTGSYEEAFHHHEKIFSNETVKAWREALQEVGAIDGWEVNKIANG